MKHKAYTSFLLILIAAMFSLMLFTSAGCEDDNPIDANAELRDADLFSLTVGKHWVFTSYSLDTANSAQIPASIHREASLVEAEVTVAGKSAFRMIDSTYSPTGEFEEIDTTYLAVEGDKLFVLNDEDSQEMWITFFDKSQGLEKEYVAGIFQVDGGDIFGTITFWGKIFPKETITVPVGTMEAYRVELKIVLKVGTETYEWIEQSIYFAEGYGPVKMTVPPSTLPGTTIKIEGEESVMVSKNF